MKRWALPGLLAIAAAASFIAWQQRSPPSADPATTEADCDAVVFEGHQFIECIAVPGRHRIETKITSSNGIIYRGFAALAKDLDARDVAFAVNGGMYDAGSRPIGYYVENGQRLHPLNRDTGEGNFYLEPNGIFFGEANGPWQVMTSDDIAQDVAKRPQFGTQSGPMLVIGGKLHPAISPTGTSLKIRNGVGVDAAGRAHFVTSDDPVSFDTMARMMSDHAKTPNALFLDGTVSSLWYPASGRMDAGYPLGPLIVVSRISSRPAVSGESRSKP